MKKVLLVHVLVLIIFSTYAQVYQFRGPNRDGKFPESNLLKAWPEGGPQLLLEFEGILLSFRTGSISMPPERLKTWII